MASESLPRIDPRRAARLDEKKVRLDRQRPLSDQTLRSLFRELWSGREATRGAVARRDLR